MTDLTEDALRFLSGVEIDGASVMKILTSADPVASFAEWALLEDSGGDRGLSNARDIFLATGSTAEEARDRVAALEEKHWPSVEASRP